MEWREIKEQLPLLHKLGEDEDLKVVPREAVLFLEADIEDHLSDVLNSVQFCLSTIQLNTDFRKLLRKVFSYRLVKLEVIQDADLHLSAETLAVLERHDIKTVFSALTDRVLQIKIIGQLSINDGTPRGITIDIVPGVTTVEKKIGAKIMYEKRVGYLVVTLFQKNAVRSLIAHTGFYPSLSSIAHTLLPHIKDLAVWLHSLNPK